LATIGLQRDQESLRDLMANFDREELIPDCICDWLDAILVCAYLVLEDIGDWSELLPDNRPIGSV
jgi:hypothetical protein